ncbi:hypothetical protein BLNAU_1049 [Blattamonas nauphoetae]|uniref:Uncharacterized protein n=1 Tax=Blattamonas nauphoetae TaxID=2049346 RepID=A0ABQ9YJR0_9EUKA|nr:hypothetical protein BLNAU_1049 [Blattamonas nauphoetae]
MQELFMLTKSSAFSIIQHRTHGQRNTDYGRLYKLKASTNTLLDFIIAELRQVQTVSVGLYPLSMIEPLLPHLLLFINSTEWSIQRKAGIILNRVTSISRDITVPTLNLIGTVGPTADINLNDRTSLAKLPINFPASSTLIRRLSDLFTDPDFTSRWVEKVQLLIRIASCLMTSSKTLGNMANCLPLTLLELTLIAAPPSNHLHILTIYHQFVLDCGNYVVIKAPFMKSLLRALTPDAPSNGQLIVTLSQFLTSLASLSTVWDALTPCLSDSTPSSRLALSLLARIEADKQETPALNENEAQQIVDRLLEIEQQCSLHTDTQNTNKTTTDGTPLSPHVDGKGQPTSSARTGTSVSQLVDVWRVMRMVVSSLARSPSGLERMQLLYPLIFLRLKGRGTSLIRKDEQAEPKKDELLTALLRVCSALTPLLRTVDCFPLVHLVSSFSNSIYRDTNHRLVLRTLSKPFLGMKEFFLRVDEATQGLYAYDITRHVLFFTPSAEEVSAEAEDVPAEADCIVSRPLPLLKLFVDTENNRTTPDQTRRQLLLHLLSTMERTNDFDLSTVCGVLLSFSRLPPGTTELIHSFNDTLIVTRNPSPPMCPEETCHLMISLLKLASPNEADSEERWRVVLREEGSEDMLNMILKEPLAELARKNGMNCTVPSFLFSSSIIFGDNIPAGTPPEV